jgi:hypothetical protein
MFKNNTVKIKFQTSQKAHGNSNLSAGKLISVAITSCVHNILIYCCARHQFVRMNTNYKNHRYMKPNIVVGKTGYKCKTAITEPLLAIDSIRTIAHWHSSLAHILAV